MLEVRTVEKKGCLMTTASVLSLGVLPLLMRMHYNQLPATLTEDGMVLRNGRHIRWSDFTRVKGTRIFVNQTYIGTAWVLKHAGGKVQIRTDNLANADEVMQFILSHVPQQAISP